MRMRIGPVVLNDWSRAPKYQIHYGIVPGLGQQTTAGTTEVGCYCDLPVSDLSTLKLTSSEQEIGLGAYTTSTDPLMILMLACIYTYKLHIYLLKWYSPYSPTLV